MFLKNEGEVIKKIIGSLRDRSLFSISIIVGLVITFFPLNYVFSLVFGGDVLLLRTLSLPTLLYLATVGSLIAGICEGFI